MSAIPTQLAWTERLRWSQNCGFLSFPLPSPTCLLFGPTPLCPTPMSSCSEDAISHTLSPSHSPAVAISRTLGYSRSCLFAFFLAITECVAKQVAVDSNLIHSGGRRMRRTWLLEEEFQQGSDSSYGTICCVPRQITYPF